MGRPSASNHGAPCLNRFNRRRHSRQPRTNFSRLMVFVPGTWCCLVLRMVLEGVLDGIVEPHQPSAAAHGNMAPSPPDFVSSCLWSPDIACSTGTDASWQPPTAAGTRNPERSGARGVSLMPARCQGCQGRGGAGSLLCRQGQMGEAAVPAASESWWAVWHISSCGYPASPE